ncbi:MAG: DUF4407 domain-containing protein, partial [Mycobacterium sp.]
AEMLWAEHQLAAARLAVEAQAEIDRAHHRRRVTEELESPAQPALHLVEPVEPVNDDIYLPIAAEAEAASLAALLPAAAHAPETDNLPASVGSDAASAQAVVHGRGATPTIPDVARAAARWIRPLVPTFVARAIDTTTQPLRAARQVFEEVEEINFSLKRTRKVTVDVEESLRPWERSAGPEGRGDGPAVFDPVDADRTAPWPIDLEGQRPAAGGLAGRPNPALAEQDRPGELEAAKGPRQLPPGH